MNQRDLSEIRRRLNPDKRNATLLRGCYVSSDGHIISTFTRAVGQLPQEENEKYMALFKRSLTGTAGQNLIPIDFEPNPNGIGDEQRLLLSLCDSALKDESAVEMFFQRVIRYVQSLYEQYAQSVEQQLAASNYLILLMHDGYDVPMRDNNDEVDRERSFGLFQYILCSVCPVKQAKPTLTYDPSESEFHSRDTDWVVAAPELGFLFPAFEERAANIHRALYYTRDASDLHDAFVTNVFGAGLQMPAAEQKEIFQTILSETLEEECSLDVVQAVHETVSEMIQEQKANKNAEPLSLTKQDVSSLLKDCGVSQERAAAFEEKYAESFGEYAELPAVNVVTPRQFRVDTPSVTIRVAPDRSDLIETRLIDGKYYILIQADGDVEVNGVKVKYSAKGA